MTITKIVIIVFLSASTAIGCSPAGSDAIKVPEAESPQFAPEIEKILDQNRNLLHRELDNSVYIETLQKENSLNAPPPSPADIEKLEKQWVLEDSENRLFQSVFNSACSERLRVFQSEHPQFAELFITDAQGRNVCLTNKTSDYYQADEAWWTDTTASLNPYGLSGPIEFDGSSSTDAVSLYLPVLDPATGNKLGIVKAIIRLSYVSEAL